MAESEVVRLPSDIRALIDSTYYERQEQGAMATFLHQLMEGTPRRKGLNALRQHAKLTLSEAGETRSDTEAQTRYSEENSTDMLLLRTIVPDLANRQTLITLLNGETLTLPWQKQRLTPLQWRRLSNTLMRQVVPCPQSQLPTTLSRQRCQQMGLCNVFYLGPPEFSDSVPFAIAIKGEGSVLMGVEHDLSQCFIYQYRQDIGLQISKIKE